jgi:hypothetical protein
VADAGEDPPLHDLDGHFDLRLVARFRRPRRQNHRPVVLSEIVGALEPGLIAARDDDPALELIADERGGDAAEERERETAPRSLSSMQRSRLRASGGDSARRLARE